MCTCATYKHVLALRIKTRSRFTAPGGPPYTPWPPPQLNAQPALVAHERRLREKITLMCLLELISSTPPEQRTLPLATVGQRTKLDGDGVEFLLMKVCREGAVSVCWTRGCRQGASWLESA